MENSTNEILMIVASNLTIAYFQREQTLLSKMYSSADLDRNSIVIIPEIYEKLLDGLKSKYPQVKTST